MQERLQKILSHAGVASRRETERLISEGHVKVNGKVVTEMGTKVDAGKDRIQVDGRLVAKEKLVYLLLYKPKGCVTTSKDPEGRQTVLDLLEGIDARVYPVGRLDYHTEGLLLLTNDGELTQALIHPRHQVEKEYLVQVKGIPSEEKLDRLRAGIRLEDGVTAPVEVRLQEVLHEKNRSVLTVVLREGRNRQVRRMFDAIGFPVWSLKRIRFAFLTLQGVRRGKWRHLTTEEVADLYQFKPE